MWLARQPQAERGEVVLLMSHFACADIPDHPLNGKQIAAFRELRAMFPGVPGSLANSPGIFLGPDAHHDLVRPGVALYGGNPTPLQLNPMRAVVELAARIVQVRNVARRRDGRLLRHLDGQARCSHRHRRGRLRRRLHARRERARRAPGRGSDRGGPPLSARRRDLDGPLGDRRDRPAGGSAASRRFRHADRRGHLGRRRRLARRDHRATRC